MRCDCISLSEPALHPASCCRCPGNSSPLCTLGPQHKKYHRHGQGSPSGTVIHIFSGLPRGRCLEPSSPESPQDGESANTPLRASVTESPSSRSDPPAALSVRGLAWGGGGGWGSRVHGIKVVLRTRYQEGFHLALPVTFSPRDSWGTPSQESTDHWFSRSGPGPAASASLGNLLKMHPRPGASKRGWSPVICSLKMPSS